MAQTKRLRVIILKPSKYNADGFVERFRWGFMPNATIPFIRSMTAQQIGDCKIETHVIDEYVETDLDYLKLLREPSEPTLLALVGVQSHQFHRALDLAAYARKYGRAHCVMGGPHPMTCDTSMLHDRGVSFALAEAEIVWSTILSDAIEGDLRPVYGAEQRWAGRLDPPVLIPPSPRQVKRYILPIVGLYPARGCPYSCNFCSVIKIAGHAVRSQPVETTMASLRAAKSAGMRIAMFTSDNFNKYSDGPELLQAMIDEKIEIPFFVQCDTQIVRQPEFIELLGRAGCFQMFVGVESFDHETLRQAKKHHNQPNHYAEIVEACRQNGITSHFSCILGFPQDTEESMRHDLETVSSMRPDVATFYILTPLPGTEQFEDFLAQGLISEKNLDRTDGKCVTWRHPHLSAQQLTDALYRAYRQFNPWSELLAKTIRRWKDQRDFRRYAGFVTTTGYGAFSRVMAFRHRHPMSGGVGYVSLDRASDYSALRREYYDIDLAPLPSSLQLSEGDERLNRMAKLIVPLVRGASASTDGGSPLSAAN